MFLFLIIFALIQLTFFILSLTRIRNSKEHIGFIYSWAFVFGAFVWEDLLVFSFFNFLVILYVLLIKDIRQGLLIFTAFWMIRSAGETLYFFMQQFTQPLHYPHDIHWHFSVMQKLFGKISNQKCFIILQVMFQIVMVLAVSILILLLQNWKYIPKGF
ncbi:MAG TPA: hypothetical protein VLF89_04435 [Candidatus Saccharimonadales bacterium]|nr:hypothetical protein [Candidatus Saccharimonadales bacterium]